MTTEILLFALVNICTIAFGYGLVWARLGALHERLGRIESWINSSVNEHGRHL